MALEQELEVARQELEQRIVVIEFLLSMVEPYPEGEEAKMEKSLKDREQAMELFKRFPDAFKNEALKRLSNAVNTYRLSPTPEHLQEVARVARGAVRRQ